jgi:murein DD-endopeptidase MepM/ murein hydrolase activator NlpD
MGRLRRGVAAALAAGLVVLVGVAQPATAADDLSHKRQQTEQQIAANEKAKQELEDQLESLTGDLAQTQKDLAAVQEQIPAAQQKVADAQAALDAAERAQKQIADQLADAQAQEATLGTQITANDGQRQQIQLAIGELAREAYRSGGDTSGLAVVLDAQSADDFVDRYSMLAAAQRTQQEVFGQLADLDAANRNAAARLAAVREKVTELKAAADQKVAEADQARKAAADAKAALDGLVAEQKAKQASLEDQKAEAQRQLDEADAASKELNDQLASIIEEQRKQAAAQKSTATPGKALPGAWFSNPTATNPIYVTSEYGMRLHPILHVWRLHAGIDLRDRCGQPVYAGRDGTVVWARLRSGYGNQVMLDHGWVNGASLMSSYNHMQSFAVSAGQKVTAGQVIGYAGNTGTSAACHLHFEVYVNGATQNPRPYLGI